MLLSPDGVRGLYRSLASKPFTSLTKPSATSFWALLLVGAKVNTLKLRIDDSACVRSLPPPRLPKRPNSRRVVRPAFQSVALKPERFSYLLKNSATVRAGRSGPAARQPAISNKATRGTQE